MLMSKIRFLRSLPHRSSKSTCEVVRTRKADVVLSSRMSRFQVNNDKQFVDDMVVRRVIAAQKSVDITDAVIKALDKSFNERKRARGEPIKRAAKENK